MAGSSRQENRENVNPNVPFEEGVNRNIFNNYPKQFYEKCRIVLRETSEITTRNIYSRHKFYTRFSELERNNSVMETDIYRLIGVYVVMGKNVFRHLDPEQTRLTDVELQISDLVMKYRMEEDETIFMPQTNISMMVSSYPFFLAEHLHRGRGTVPDKIPGFPRCLGFEGADELIPRFVQWDTMKILWKIWKSSLSICEYDLVSYSARGCESFRSVDSHGRFFIMHHFKISPPRRDEVIDIIREMMRRRGYTEQPKGFRIEDFQNALPLYAEDIHQFYVDVLLVNFMDETIRTETN